MPTPRFDGRGSATFETELPEQWAIRSVFGGWIARTLAHAAATVLPGDRVMASASVTFARAVPAGPVTIAATLVRGGRSYGFVVCELSTPAGVAVTAQFTFVPRDRLPVVGPAFGQADAPALAPAAAGGRGAGVTDGNVAAQVDWRAESDWRAGANAGAFHAWIAAREPELLDGDAINGQLVDPAWYLVAADLIGPALVSPERPAFWVATVTLEVQVLALTYSPWLRQSVSARTAGQDTVGSLTLATPTGEIVATSTQRAVLLPAEPHDLPFAVTGFGWGVSSSADSRMIGMN